MITYTSLRISLPKMFLPVPTLAKEHPSRSILGGNCHSCTTQGKTISSQTRYIFTNTELLRRNAPRWIPEHTLLLGLWHCPSNAMLICTQSQNILKENLYPLHVCLFMNVHAKLTMSKCPISSLYGHHKTHIICICNFQDVLHQPYKFNYRLTRQSRRPSRKKRLTLLEKAIALLTFSQVPRPTCTKCRWGVIGTSWAT